MRLRDIRQLPKVTQAVRAEPAEPGEPMSAMTLGTRARKTLTGETKVDDAHSHSEIVPEAPLRSPQFPRSQMKTLF